MHKIETQYFYQYKIYMHYKKIIKYLIMTFLMLGTKFLQIWKFINQIVTELKVYRPNYK